MCGFPPLAQEDQIEANQCIREFCNSISSSIFSPTEYKQAVSPLATAVAAVPGCRWKIWILDEVTSEAGGIYLFEDEASGQSYLEAPVVAQVASHPALSDFSVKQFDVLEEETAVTRGPIEERTQA